MNFRKRRNNREFANKKLLSLADLGIMVMMMFVFTITVFNEKGLNVKLPSYPDAEVSGCNWRQSVFRIVINGKDELLVKGKVIKLSDLRTNIKTYILNPNNDENMASNPTRALLSLQNDIGTSYGTYFDVYHEIKAAYKDIWNEESKRRFGYKFKHLDDARKHQILSDFPIVLSEAEPTQFAKR